MLNNKGPLMFINTVNTQIDDSSSQKVFDSRNNNQKNQKVEATIESTPNEEEASVDDYSDFQDEIYSYSEEDYQNYPTEAYSNTYLEAFPEELARPRFIEERKIKNIIEMYNKNRPVLCNVIVKDIEIIGIPYKMDDAMLYIKTSENHCEKVRLDSITDIIIIKF